MEYKKTVVRRKPRFYSVATGISLLLLSGQLAAENRAITQINAAVGGFLKEFHTSSNDRQRFEIKVGFIDPRLNLPDCEIPLLTQLNGNTKAIGKVQVKVSCAGDQPWSKYVGAQVDVYEEVAIAAMSLRRGNIIQEQHIELAEINLASLRRTPVFDSETLLGMELKYPLTAGDAYSLDRVKLPVVIERGDLVQMVAETRNLQIKQQGEALQDGAVGSVINVRNSSSEMVVQAEVISAGRVKIQL